MRHMLISLFLVLSSLSVCADQIELNPNHPQKYTVVRGDTLWDIAGKFLRYPWEWDKIWQGNPDIQNPDLIYPGDILSLGYDEAGNPRVTISPSAQNRPSDGTVNGVVRLSPEIRLSPTREAIPLIPLNAIKQFLTSPKVVTQSEMEELPYVVGFADEHLIGGAGDRIYVKNIEDFQFSQYVIFREGQTYIDPMTNEFLGFEAKYVGDASLERQGRPATLSLTRTRSEVLIGDRLMSSPDHDFILNYQPRKPEQSISGHIISVLDGVTQIGQYNVVVINRGIRDGIETGHLFDIYQQGQLVYDSVTEDSSDQVRLPDERNGVLMVFRPFEKVSYALIMYTRRSLHVFDRIEPLR